MTLGDKVHQQNYQKKLPANMVKIFTEKSCLTKIRGGKIFVVIQNQILKFFTTGTHEKPPVKWLNRTC